jgi:hypothetical protein
MSAYSWLVKTRGAEGVLLTGVYGSCKSSVAEDIAYLLEQRGEPYAEDVGCRVGLTGSRSRRSTWVLAPAQKLALHLGSVVGWRVRSARGHGRSAHVFG